VVQAHGRVTPVTLWERTSHSRPQSLVHDPDAWSKEEVTADGMSRKPVSTRPRLRWNNDFEIEGEVRRCVDTFSEHDSSDFLPFRRRHQDRDVAKRTFRRIAPRSRSRATSADDGVVALIGPILASNGGRVPARSFVGPSRRTVGATQAACAGDRPKATTSRLQGPTTASANEPQWKSTSGAALPAWRVTPVASDGRGKSAKRAMEH
jgi:hypothetical protein